jgi:hypothetical protein
VILPIAFLPRHSIPRLASDPYANLLEKAPAPSTAVLANFDETSVPSAFCLRNLNSTGLALVPA